MSSYNDINQLLEEIGTSARSAGDPWTLSRAHRGTVRADSFNPSVVADFGAPIKELSSEVQASQKIEQADSLAGSTASSGQSTGSGFFSGILDALPLASGIAKLFGFGDKPSAPVLTPYELPPSISFEGAVSSSTSGVGSLSYGADGLPRVSQNVGTATLQKPMTTHTPSVMSGELSALAGSNVDSMPVEFQNLSGTVGTQGGSGVDPIADVAINAGSPFNNSDRYLSSPGDVVGQQSSASGDSPNANISPQVNSQTDLAAQLSSLTGSAFTPEQSGGPSILSADFLPGSNVGMSSSNVASGFSSDAQGQPGTTASTSSTGSNSAQSQSILVQVQAMDSQSFMDHSQDIAQAVRQAMLNLNSLNDVILDL